MIQSLDRLTVQEIEHDAAGCVDDLNQQAVG